jgi:MFS family permease
MSRVSSADIASAPRPAGHLSRGAAFYLLASISVSLLASSSVPTPLYAIYQAAWGFSSVTLTIIFGGYAIAVLSSLLVFGRLSDHVGRRPILIFATAGQAFVMIAFFLAANASDLLLARIVQGLITGAAIAAVGAGMIDLDKSRGAVANAVAPVFGTAIGAAIAGALAQFLPQPTHLVFVLFTAVFVAQFIGVILMDESVSPTAGAVASLQPRFTLPMAARSPMFLAIPVLVALWALAGFYGALGPTLIRGMFGSQSPLLGGMALFVLGSSAVTAVLILQHRDARLMLAMGASALLIGTGVTVLSLPYHFIVVFFAGTIIAGVGFGLGFQGALRTIMPHTAAHERAGVLSLIYVVSYLALGLPTVAAGYFLSRHVDILLAAQVFGMFVMTLSAVALLGTAWGLSRSRGLTLS